jgi:netrin-G3 ligand
VVLTSEAAPATPPTMLNISAHNSTALNLSWSKPIQPNGIITHYSINCSNETVSSRYITNSTSETELISGLLPYTNYTCSVSGYTIVGRGPEDSIIGLTDQSTPEAVTSLMYNVINDTAVSVSWNKPSRPNGIIKDYEVMAFVESEIQYVSNITNNSIIPLEPHTPYFISVAGYTIKGRGDVSNTSIFFTRETIPMFGPQNISASWINRTAIVIRWKPLTLVEARGFLTRYTITAEPLSTSSTRKRQEPSELVVMTSPDNSSTLISDGLIPILDYVIFVSASTRIGESVNNFNITLSALENPVPIAAISGGIFGVILCIFLLLVILCLVWCCKNFHSKVKIKVNEMYTFTRKIESDLESKGFELPLIEGSLYQNVNITDKSVNSRIRYIKGFPQFVKTSREIVQTEYSEIDTNSPDKSVKVAKQFPTKNRFQNISPFDDNLVTLPLILNEEGSNYINASYVDGYQRMKAYIAAQGPLPHTAVDFWRMIWEYKLPTIIMLTQLLEKGITKCAQYWPEQPENEEEFGFGIKVTLKAEEVNHGYTKRKLTLKNDNSSTLPFLNVTQYHFTEWPDHGAPSDKIIMISLIQRIREVHPPDGPPLVVHCSAGVGRTGTFIVLDTMLQRMEKEDTLNIYDHILQIRHQRVKLVQAEAQYIYIHEALSEYIQCGRTFFPISSTYHNMEELRKRDIGGDGKSGFEKQFELLNKLSDNINTLSCSDGEENQDCNRYDYNLPYNDTRVVLISDGNDYINASRVSGYKFNSRFLVTQAPMKNTMESFWKMILQEKSKSIIVLCTEFPPFWETETNGVYTHDNVTIKTDSVEQEINFNIYTLEIKIDTSEGTVTLFHYHNWTEHDTPQTNSSFLSLFESIMKNQRQTGNKPVTVVCKDGVGRSGTLITIYAQLERVKTEGVADIFQFIKKARSQRAGLVQQIEQYIFCHEVLGEYAEEMSTYDNFKHVV